MSGTQRDFQQKLQSIDPLFKPENIQVVKDGEVIGPEGVDDYDSFMQFLMLASIASYLADRTSEGLVQNWALTVTPVAQEIICDYPAQSFYIINDGASPIFVEINRRHKTASQLLITEDMAVDFETHKLKRFYVYCGPGGAATARAWARR